MTGDAELVLRARGGDELAAQTLIRRHRSLVGAIASKYFARGLEKDDLIQEGLLGLYKAIRDYRPDRESSFRTFACQCVERQVITAVKTASRKKHVPLNTAASFNAPVGDGGDSTLGELLPGPSASPFDALVDEETGLQLDAAMQTLTPLERHVIQGVANGTPYEQIAATLQVNEKAVDNAAQRARCKLAARLDLELGAAA